MVNAPSEPPYSGDPNPPASLRRAPPLQSGDTVALFSPGSHPRRDSAHLIDTAARALEDWGLKPRLPEAPTRRHLYLAGTDRQRADEFERLYTDPDIKALFATRGGYGTARMLPLLDPDAISRAAPTHVVGMSDLSALQAYLMRVAGLGSIHGPCLAAPAHAASGAREADEARLRALLFDPAPPPALPCSPMHLPNPGAAGDTVVVRGRLIGGNLAVLASLLGTPWALETHGAILFLEEINEAPYRVDRALTHFRMAGNLGAPAAVVFGHMRGCDEDPPGLLEQVLRDLFADASFPVATGLPAGHDSDNRALPLGMTARLELPTDGGPGTLAFEG